MMTNKFRPGESGNPGGRPKGTIDRRTALLKDLENDLPSMIDTLKTKALEGDLQALKILIDRVMPVRKSSYEPVSIPMLAEAASLTAKADAVITSTAEGSLAPDIAAQLINALGTAAKIEEVTELRARVEALETTLNPRNTQP